MSGEASQPATTNTYRAAVVLNAVIALTQHLQDVPPDVIHCRQGEGCRSGRIHLSAGEPKEEAMSLYLTKSSCATETWAGYQRRRHTELV